MSSKNRWVSVVAGSSYGSRMCSYEIINGKLVLRDKGKSDGLAGNSEALGFDGLSIEEAEAKIASINAETLDSEDDGSHASTFSIKLEDLKEEDVPTQESDSEISSRRELFSF